MIYCIKCQEPFSLAGEIVTVHINLFNVHQRALPIERSAVCMNECMCECCDKTRGFSIFRI